MFPFIIPHGFGDRRFLATIRRSFIPASDVGFSFLPGIDLGFYFGGGWGLWGGFGWGWGPDWFGRRILLNGNFFHRYGFADYHRGMGGVWAHDPGHRMGVPYANRAVARSLRRCGRSARYGRISRGGELVEAQKLVEARKPVRAGNALGGRSAAPAPRSFAPAERGNHSAFGGIQNGGTTRMQSDHGFSSIGPLRLGGGGGGFHGAAVEAEATVAEAGDNMTARTFTSIFVAAAGAALAQTPKIRKPHRRLLNRPKPPLRR